MLAMKIYRVSQMPIKNNPQSSRKLGCHGNYQLYSGLSNLVANGHSSGVFVIFSKILPWMCSAYLVYYSYITPVLLDVIVLSLVGMVAKRLSWAAIVPCCHSNQTDTLELYRRIHTNFSFYFNSYLQLHVPVYANYVF